MHYQLQRISLWIFLVSFNFVYASDGIDLPVREWVGLGFYLAPYERDQEPLYYKNCFEDELKFMQVPYSANQSKIFTVMKVGRKAVQLKGISGKLITCHPDSEGHYPELIFYKDILDARSQFLGQRLYSKVKSMKTFRADGSWITVPIEKFEEVLVKKVELCPISEKSSVRIHLETLDQRAGFVDVKVTNVNRKPGGSFLQDMFFLENPAEVLDLKQNDWLKIQKGKVGLGMSQEEVILSRGKPYRRFTLEDQEILIYRKGLNSYHHVFHKDKLIAIEHYLDDEVRTQD